MGRVEKTNSPSLFKTQHTVTSHPSADPLIQKPEINGLARKRRASHNPKTFGSKIIKFLSINLGDKWPIVVTVHQPRLLVNIKSHIFRVLLLEI